MKGAFMMQINSRSIVQHRSVVLLFLCLLYGACFTASAQEPRIIDSLTAQYRYASDEQDKILLLGEIAKQLSFLHPDTALMLGNECLERSRAAGFRKGEAVSLNAVGSALFTKSEYRHAWDKYSAALKISEEIGDDAMTATGYLNLGNIFYYQNDKPKALENFRKSLEIGERINDQFIIAGASVNIGTIYVDRQEYAKGLEHLFKAADSFTKQRNKKGLSYCFRNIAIGYQLQQDIPNALKYLQRSLTFAEQIHNKELISGCLQAFADIYRSQGDFRKSIEWGRRSLAMAQQLNDLPYVMGAATTLAATYEAMNDYRNALRYTVIARTAGESILSNDKNKELQQLQHKFEMEGKQKEIDLLEQRSQNQQLVAVLFATGLGAVVIIAFVLFRNFRREKESKERLALINQEKQRLINDLTVAMENIRTLGELLPICSNCKSIRDDKGYWQAVDRYISSHTDTKVSHGICPDCIDKLYPEYAEKLKKKMQKNEAA